MALFFETFRHNTLAESLGIPVFPMSKNELKHQKKYEDDIHSLSGENSSFLKALKGLDKFAAMDANRNRRQSVLMSPPQEIIPADLENTEKRSNTLKVRDEIRKSLTCSRKSRPLFTRSASEMGELKLCLDLAKKDFKFDNQAFHRNESGAMKAPPKSTRTSLIIRKVRKFESTLSVLKLSLLSCCYVACSIGFRCNGH
jgi:elongation factor 2 kinase